MNTTNENTENQTSLLTLLHARAHNLPLNPLPTSRLDSATDTTSNSTLNPTPHSTSKAISHTTSPSNAETPEPTALSAGTTPEQPRNAAEIKPEYSAHSAGTTTDTHLPPKPNSNESPLDFLPEETQAAILRLLETRSLDEATLEITSKPPYGFGISTSRSSLNRFHERHTKARLTRAREEDAAATAKLIAQTKSPEDYAKLSLHLINLRLLEAAISDTSNPNHLLALSRTVDRLRAADHAERRLRLAEAKSKIPS